MRRVVMIGSRALGSPRPDSDLDLVVLVEIRPDAPPWGPADVIAERRRIQQQLGPPLTDLWVRTTDRYEEARRVAGGVEMLVDTEGVAVYARPFGRAPIVRRTPQEVRREHVSAWMEHALAALEGAIAMQNGAVRPGTAPGQPHTAAVAARICVERAVSALLAFHGIAAQKSGGLARMVPALRARDRQLAEWLHRAMAAPTNEPPHLACTLVRRILHRLMEDGELRPYLGSAQQRLSRAVALISNGVPQLG